MAATNDDAARQAEQLVRDGQEAFTRIMDTFQSTLEQQKTSTKTPTPTPESSPKTLRLKREAEQRSDARRSRSCKPQDVNASNQEHNLKVFHGKLITKPLLFAQYHTALLQCKHNKELTLEIAGNINSKTPGFIDTKQLKF